MTSVKTYIGHTSREHVGRCHISKQARKVSVMRIGVENESTQCYKQWLDSSMTLLDFLPGCICSCPGMSHLHCQKSLQHLPIKDSCDQDTCINRMKGTSAGHQPGEA